MHVSLYRPSLKPKWSEHSDQALLNLRLKDVYLPIEKTGLNPLVQKLYSELEAKGIMNFRPHVWFSDEWFTPSGHKGIAVPFYLAHPKLAELENHFIGEVEGGNPKWFMKLIRHECGHAIDNAFGLRRRWKRQRLFGKSTQKYSKYYKAAKPSPDFVNHLGHSYAQSHPDEDFAETFAVWLTPRSAWKQNYIGLALEKLEYIDELMLEVSSARPKIRHNSVADPQYKLSKTLKQHYQARQRYYGIGQYSREGDNRLIR
jgi:hypothetical protein